MNVEEPALASILKPLISACSSGDVGTVDYLLAEWDPSSKTVPEYKLRQALEVATRRNQLRVVVFLLERGFQLDRHVIAAAVRARSVLTLETFLNYGWNINNRWHPWVMPGICSAIMANDIELVQWFLSHGARAGLRQTRYSSFTPLTWAVIYASLDIVQLLVAHGARVDRGDLLASICGSRMPGRLGMIKYLVDQGAPINDLERFSGLSAFPDTPLHRAVRHNRPAFAAMLLSFGADGQLKNVKGKTPLDLAKELQLTRMIELLKEE